MSQLHRAAALLLAPALLCATPRLAAPQEGAAPSAIEPCVVRLLDGRVLRGKAQPGLPAAGEPLRLETARGPLEVPAAELVSVRALAELRREAEALRSSLAADPRRGVRLASWMASQGLHEEIERELDPVLAADPADPLATSVLRGLDVEELVPLPDGDLNALCRAALRAGEQALGHPTKLRLAELRLERLSPDLYEPLLANAVLSKRSGERAFAVGAIARLMPKEGLKRLLERALLDRQKDVRQVAQKELARSSDPGIVFPLLRGLDSKHPQVRLNAIDALAALGDPRALGDLILRVTHSGGTGQRVNVSFTKQISYVSDFDVEVAQAAAIADPVINVLQEGAVLDVTLVGTHGETDYYVERSRALDALKKISGKDLGRDPKAWTEWWQTQREEVVAAYLVRRGFPPEARNGG
ncbi:MAG: HEAT repeat domain-containing protein [Planctomycetes bacterium]|nr:HEAT repeat domain-containing protein [Planctomycetota bacterium]